MNLIRFDDGSVMGSMEASARSGRSRLEGVARLFEAMARRGEAMALGQIGGF